MQNARDGVFLASKTHERSRTGALGLLGRSLKTLGVDHLDLWQMHDLRTEEDLEEMFAKGGAIEAAEEAKQAGKVRFVGLTGHHDPAILMAAMDRYAFDCVLVINMKVLAAGRFVRERAATAEERIRYAMGLERAAFERRIAHQASRYAYFKAS